jgi:hypothetical protein
MKKIILTLALLCSLGSTAQAANWIGIDETKMVAVDTDTMNRTGNKITSWQRVIFEETALVDGQDCAYIKVLVEVDVFNRTQRLLEINNYTVNGDFISVFYPNSTSRIVPGSRAERWMKFVAKATQPKK